MDIILPKKYKNIPSGKRRKVREEYVRRQEGKCCHCGAPLFGPPAEQRDVDTTKFPPGFFDFPVHLHHDHHTGYTVGAAHALCNAVLFQYYGE